MSIPTRPKVNTSKLVSTLIETIEERDALLEDLRVIDEGLVDTPYHEKKLRDVLHKEYRECFERLVEIDSRLYAVDVLLYVT